MITVKPPAACILPNATEQYTANVTGMSRHGGEVVCEQHSQWQFDSGNDYERWTLYRSIDGEELFDQSGQPKFLAVRINKCQRNHNAFLRNLPLRRIDSGGWTTEI